MTGNRAASFERRGATCPSHMVHPVPRQLARTRRAVTSVAAWRKIAVIVKMLFCFLREPRSYPVDASGLGQSAQSLYCCPVSCRCSVEWVSGQVFFCTETARGPRRATENPPPSTQCRDRRLHKMLPAVPDRCFNPPLFQSTAVSIHRCFNPPLGQSIAGPIHRDRQSIAIANPSRSPIQSRGPSGPEVQALRISVVFVVLRLASVLKLKTE